MTAPTPRPAAADALEVAVAQEVAPEELVHAANELRSVALSLADEPAAGAAVAAALARPHVPNPSGEPS